MEKVNYVLGYFVAVIALIVVMVVDSGAPVEVTSTPPVDENPLPLFGLMVMGMGMLFACAMTEKKNWKYALIAIAVGSIMPFCCGFISVLAYVVCTLLLFRYSAKNTCVRDGLKRYFNSFISDETKPAA